MTQAERFPRGSRPLRESLVVLGLTLATLVLVQVCVVTASGGPLLIPLGLSMLGTAYAGAGLVAWHRRPRNHTGLLLILGALANLFVGFANTDVRPLQVVGYVFGTLPFAVIIHLLLAFPSGRLAGRWSRATVAAAYVNAVVLQAPLYLFAGEPDGLLGGPARPELVAAAQVTQRWVGIAVVATAAVVLSRRLLAGDPRQRRVLGPLYLYGIVTLLSIPLSNVVVPWLGLDRDVVFPVQIVALAGIPVAFTVSLLRGGFAPAAEVDDLALWLGSDAPRGTRPRMAEALARTLGDPSLRITFDEFPPVSRARTATDLAHDGRVEVDLDGRRVAQISYNPALLADRRQVEAAGRVVGIALDRERLTDELMEHSRELQESRARLVNAQDQERRRIVRDLHDGLQSQLVLLSWRAAKLAKTDDVHQVGTDALDLHHDLDRLGAEVRALIHGLMPALLTEQGLFAAVHDLADALPVDATTHTQGSDADLSGVVETTAYFVVAESLTNVVKHAGATRVEVRLAREPTLLRVLVADDGVGGAGPRGGTGLRGMVDRVEALGGSLRLASPAGGGTRIEMEVPCAQ